ncbi:DUF5133 domain-containing protein [Streptomyces sp. TRM66268-LWL]|uniref:DUF5133 domain-containing protein n=1 Tax=Streptomyces polyasparticus TaxID=2767826 RepID=A0ABR7SDG4_9ACTN|nr:DUF5133 domain-containing protein [Streptomyces polyasparticus]MBC9713024.1 DUF5133 domain-containing protein [Streptomyces polyasparticus]
MLMAHPAVLLDLMEEYTSLKILDAENGSPAVQRRLDDVAYTLCVATGTRDIDMALIAARHRLSGARTADDSLAGESLPDDSLAGA